MIDDLKNTKEVDYSLYEEISGNKELRDKVLDYAIDKGMIYPNLNFTEPMPETELLSETGVKSETGLIPETSFQEGLPIRHVLSNSFGFGGNDSSLLFSATNFPA